jgi:hypothetical protein
VTGAGVTQVTRLAIPSNIAAHTHTLFFCILSVFRNKFIAAFATCAALLQRLAEE